jgi:hypothetical protein
MLICDKIKEENLLFFTEKIKKKKEIREKKKRFTGS